MTPLSLKYAIVSLGLCLAYVSPVRATFSSLNVKDYGAVGDGVADDTAAIQRTVDAAMEIEGKNRTRLGTAQGLVGGSKASAYPEVVFPEGRYKISETILLQQSLNLRGQGRAVVFQSDKSKDVFYFQYSYRSCIEGLGLEGGRAQLRFWTGNLWARILVKNCSFRDSVDYAIQCVSFAEKGQDDENAKPWPPYLVENVKGRPKLTPNTAKDLIEWYNSTLFSVEGCKFENCRRAISVACDTTVLRDISVVANGEMDGAPLNLGGQCHVYNLSGTAAPGQDKDQYWIDAHGNLALRGVTLESESGMGFIRSSVEPRATTRGIRLEDCRVRVAGSTENALILIKEGTMPNIISLKNIVETSGLPVRAIAWASPVTPNELKKIQFYSETPLEAQFKISFSNLSSNISDALPEALYALVQSPLPADALSQVTVGELSWTDSGTARILRAEEHGIDPASRSDQTARIQELFDLAAKENADVVFPGAATYLVSDTIRLPGKTNVRCEGVAFFQQNNSDRDLFSVDGAENITFRNCDFVGGRRAFSIHTDPKVPGVIQFDYCSFFDQKDAAIECLSGNGNIGEPNATTLLVKNAIFWARQSVVTNAGRTQLDTFWGITDPHLNDQAFIENRGGKMRVQAMLGNPRLWYGERSKPPKGIKDWPFGRNTRWIDNWGNLEVQDTRFGGESGGMCNVFNRSPQGTVYINGGLTRFNNSATRRSILFAEETPQQTCLRDISSFPGKSGPGYARIMARDGQPLDESKSNVLVTGVLAP